jgi:hypothetical protein
MSKKKRRGSERKKGAWGNENAMMAGLASWHDGFGTVMEGRGRERRGGLIHRYFLTFPVDGPRIRVPTSSSSSSWSTTRTKIKIKKGLKNFMMG